MIVEMKKIIVLCTQSNQDEMLKSLRSLKVLHLDKIKETNNEKLELVSKKIDDIEKTRVILNSFKNNEVRNDKIDNLIDETLLLNNDLESLKNKEKQITDEINRIEDFGNFNPKDIKQLVIDYKTTFGSESGQRELDDLKKRCSFETTTLVKGDSHESALLEGQRSMVLFLNNMLNKKEK